MYTIKELADAILTAKNVASSRELSDIETLYATPHGFPYELDKKNAPQAETLYGSRKFGKQVNILMGKPRPWGMNIVGQTKDGNWVMKQDFREAIELLNLFPYTPPARNDNNDQPESQDELKAWQNSFEEQISISLHESEEIRKHRIENANKFPKRVALMTYVFVRNSDIVVETLLRAKGVCEKCNSPAPFTKKSNGEPYLEVHHKVPLAKNGEDSLENTIALCPNCHRENHYG